MEIAEFKAAFRAADTTASAALEEKNRLNTALFDMDELLDEVADPVSRGLYGQDLRKLLAEVARVDPRHPDATETLRALTERSEQLHTDVRGAAELGLPEMTQDEELMQLEAWYTVIQANVQAASGVQHPQAKGLQLTTQRFVARYIPPPTGQGLDPRHGQQLLQRMENLAATILNDRDDEEARRNRVTGLLTELQPDLTTLATAFAAGDLGEPPDPAVRFVYSEHLRLQASLDQAILQDNLDDMEVLSGELADVVRELFVLISPAAPDLSGLSDEETLLLNEAEAEESRDEDYEVRQRYFALFQSVVPKAQIAERKIRLKAKTPLPEGAEPKLQKLVDLNAELFQVTKSKPVNYHEALRVAEEMQGQITLIEQTTSLAPPPSTFVPAPPETPTEASIKKRKTAVDRACSRANKVLDRNLRAAIPDVARTWVTSRDLAQNALAHAVRAKDWAAANTALNQMEQAIKVVDDAVKLHVATRLNTLEQEGNYEQMVIESGRFARCTPGVLKGTSVERLDAMVQSLGGTAENDKQKLFMKEALEAKFDLKIEGAMTSKAAPRLYSTMSKVPLEHIRDNPRLVSLKRERPLIAEGASYYSPKENAIVLKLVRTGNIAQLTGQKTERLDQDSDVDDNCRIDNTEVARFDAVTLHEVGHAVDERDKLMEKLGGRPSYGGWRTHKVSEVAERVAVDKGFYDRFRAVKRSVLRAYLVAVLQGKDAKKVLGSDELEAPTMLGDDLDTDAITQDPGVVQAEKVRARLTEEEWTLEYILGARESCKSLMRLVDRAANDAAVRTINAILAEDRDQALPLADALDRVCKTQGTTPKHAPVTNLDWSALARDEAVTHCAAIRMSRGDGLWSRGAAAAGRYALKDKRLYFESYKGDWTSYQIDARKKGVSSYQFRAPAEWFAEIYATYYLGKLPTANPLYTWLESQEAE